MSSNTPNLDLLKKDPITDGADTFNIESMLNGNWDKIDDAVGLVMTEATSAKQAGNERKAQVVAALIAKGVQATTSESWDILIPKIVAIVTATGTAVLADVLAGKTFSTAAGNAMVGTMPDLRNKNTVFGAEMVASLNVYAGNPNYAQLKLRPPTAAFRGYIDETGTMETHIYGLLPSTVKSGQVVGNTAIAGASFVGTYGSDGTVGSAQMLSGYVGYNASGRIVGTMPVASDPTTHWLSAGASYGPYSSGDPNAYIYFDTQGMVGKYNSNISWARFPVGDIIPSNFRAGKTAFGGQLVGTMVEGKKFVEVNVGIIEGRGLRPVNLPFVPSKIELWTPTPGGTGFQMAACFVYGGTYNNKITTYVCIGAVINTGVTLWEMPYSTGGSLNIVDNNLPQSFNVYNFSSTATGNAIIVRAYE